jgi:hypothetical protein
MNILFDFPLANHGSSTISVIDGSTKFKGLSSIEALIIMSIVIGGLFLIAGSVGLSTPLVLGIIVIATMIFYIWKQFFLKSDVASRRIGYP